MDRNRLFRPGSIGDGRILGRLLPWNQWKKDQWQTWCKSGQLNLCNFLPLWETNHDWIYFLILLEADFFAAFFAFRTNFVGLFLAVFVGKDFFASFFLIAFLTIVTSSDMKSITLSLPWTIWAPMLPINSPAWRDTLLSSDSDWFTSSEVLFFSFYFFNSLLKLWINWVSTRFYKSLFANSFFWNIQSEINNRSYSAKANNPLQR